MVVTDRVVGVYADLNPEHVLTMLHHCSYQALTSGKTVAVFTHDVMEADLMSNWIPQILPMAVKEVIQVEDGGVRDIRFDNESLLRIVYDKNINSVRGMATNIAFLYKPDVRDLAYIQPVIASSPTAWLLAPKEG